MQALVACDSLQFSETKAGADLRLRLLELSSLASPRHRLPRRSYSPILLNEFRSIVKIQAPALVSEGIPNPLRLPDPNPTTTKTQSSFDFASEKNQSFSSSLSLLVCARLTGISLARLSFIFSM